MTFRDWLGLTVTAVWLSAMLAHSSAAEPTAAGPTR